MFTGVALVSMAVGFFPLPEDAKPWYGHMVAPRSVDVVLFELDKNDKKQRAQPAFILYTVIKDDNVKLRLRNGSREAWGEKVDWLKLADADKSYTEQLRNDLENARLWNLRASVRLELGRIDESVADFGEAIRLRPMEPHYYANRARALTNKHDDDKAPGSRQSARIGARGVRSSIKTRTQRLTGAEQSRHRA